MHERQLYQPKRAKRACEGSKENRRRVPAWTGRSRRKTGAGIQFGKSLPVRCSKAAKIRTDEDEYRRLDVRFLNDLGGFISEIENDEKASIKHAIPIRKGNHVSLSYMDGISFVEERFQIPGIMDEKILRIDDNTNYGTSGSFSSEQIVNNVIRWINEKYGVSFSKLEYDDGFLPRHISMCSWEQNGPDSFFGMNLDDPINFLKKQENYFYFFFMFDLMGNEMYWPEYVFYHSDYIEGAFEWVFDEADETLKEQTTQEDRLSQLAWINKLKNLRRKVTISTYRSGLMKSAFSGTLDYKGMADELTKTNRKVKNNNLAHHFTAVIRFFRDMAKMHDKINTLQMKEWINFPLFIGVFDSDINYIVGGTEDIPGDVAYDEFHYSFMRHPGLSIDLEANYLTESLIQQAKEVADGIKEKGMSLDFDLSEITDQLVKIDIDDELKNAFRHLSDSYLSLDFYKRHFKPKRDSFCETNEFWDAFNNPSFFQFYKKGIRWIEGNVLHRPVESLPRFSTI